MNGESLRCEVDNSVKNCVNITIEFVSVSQSTGEMDSFTPMKYNLSINTKAVYELAPELDGTDYFILDYVYYICSSISTKIAKKRIIDDEGVWTWIDYKHLSSEIPWINIKTKGGISKRIDKLEISKFIKTKNAGGFKLYVRLLPRIDSAFTAGNAEAPAFTPGNASVSYGKRSYIEDNNTKSYIAKRADASSLFLPFDLKEEIEKLKISKQRHIQLIGEYLEEKKIKLDNKKQFDKAVSRHLRDAVDLAAFSDEQIGQATLKAEKEYPQYTLGTLVKILTR